jgi:DNA mismatch repair protein MutL
MREKIRVLPPEVVDQIAAGEVVERPSSALKELLENSIDADSTEITIRAANGGVGVVEVSDNGWGMTMEESLLALQRHATSKISSVEDLGQIRTLGFRGEALSSIAAISKMELVTRALDEQVGTRILVEGGLVKECTSWGAPKGTMVRVEELFYNVPARRKFLRSISTEAHHLRDVVERMAAVYPHIGFRYEYEGRTVLDCPRVSQWEERVEQILGHERFENLYPIHYDSKGVLIRGFLSHPNFHRNASSSLWFYVNGRAVQDRTLLHSVMRGYGSLLERGRYPVGIIHIEMDPDEVDVNVHPTKREVRFQRPREVQGAVVSAVRSMLESRPWLSLVKGLRCGEEVHSAQVSEKAASFFSPEPSPPPVPEVEQRSISFDEEALHGEELKAIFLGQIQETYLAFEMEGGLVLVDQHAAHERVLYEGMLAEMERGGRIASQSLLLEEVVDLSPAEAEILETVRETLERVGWSIQEFGGDSCVIRAIPHWMEPGTEVEALRELLAGLTEAWGGLSKEELTSRVIAQLACAAAIKAGRPVRREQALSLLRQLGGTARSGLCPHGRPTMVEITSSEINRWFKRS